jgi:predicted nuclease of predicted toxin-antitoxin system
MRFLLDQGTPRSAAARLRDAGHDAIHTAEVGLAEAEDKEVLAKAREEGRVVVTLDADFHAELALSRGKGPSVVRIRIEGLRAEPLVELLQAVVQQAHDELEAGAMISVQEGRIRVRRLPVG